MDFEAEILSFRNSGDLRAAAARAVEGYGPEVLGFLVTLLRDEQLASDVFSQVCEELWSNMNRFEGRSSFRTWFYVLARNAAFRSRRSPQHKAKNRASLNELADVAERVRSATLPYLRTDVKDALAAIRNALAEDDRALLVLRVDRDMSWLDIARIFSAGDQSEAALVRAAARLRKQFQGIKQEIRRQARVAGLLPDHDY